MYTTFAIIGAALFLVTVLMFFGLGMLDGKAVFYDVQSRNTFALKFRVAVLVVLGTLAVATGNAWLLYLAAPFALGSAAGYGYSYHKAVKLSE